MKPKLIKRLVLWILLLPILLVAAILVFAFIQQDKIIQSQISALNESYSGKIEVGKVHLAPFANFPDISIKVDDVKVLEGKEEGSATILEVADIYVGFNIWDILEANYDIHSLIVEEGYFDLVIHPDGETNIQKAFASQEESTDEPPIEIHMQKIELRKLDFHKLTESSNLDIETYIYWAKGGFKTKDEIIEAHVDTEFELNVLDNGDTTYLKHKHFEFHTDLTYDQNTSILVFKPSGIKMEHGDFELEGTVDIENDLDLDLSVQGTNPSFDMFIAFAPEEVIPVLERYENAGKIYFEAIFQGPTTEERFPFIDAKFGASEAYWENTKRKRRIDDMGFAGHFSNGAERNLKTMEFSLNNMTAKLDKGTFIGTLKVNNFEEPEIEMELDASFDVPFVVGFLNLNEIQNARGSVDMNMKFHDVIDLDHPEKALNELNQAYFAELIIENLAVETSDLPAALNDLDAHVVMNGKEAQLEQFDMELGNSDISITGFLSDLPAVVHHNPVPVEAHLEIESDRLDIAEISGYKDGDTIGVDEQIDNLKMLFSFKALANAFTEFEHLPKGEFFIDDFHADLKHYPHSFHDFHADILIDDRDLKIVDFSGNIDDSDFHFDGLVHDYGFWMGDSLEGDVDLDLSLTSDRLKFKSLFSYQGENYVPEDYRHEQIEGLRLHLESSMHYRDNGLHSIDMELDRFDGKMHVHPLRFSAFSGRLRYENDHIRMDHLDGKIGDNDITITLHYFLGNDYSQKKRENKLTLRSEYIDFDAITNYNEAPPSPDNESTPIDKKADVADHAEAFNIYELPFTDMKFDVRIDQLVYHRLKLQKIKSKLRTTRDHYIYVDTTSFYIAGGQIAMNGYFNGSDPDHIYLKPKIRITEVDLDRLLFKFENFGQDVIVSDNLHGRLSGTVTGNIRVYPDLIVDLDQSEVHMDAQILDGRLENYDPMLLLKDYFGDKDLSQIKFDTLANHMDISNGVISIPNMTIESTLGHMDIEGSQDMDDNINYYVRIPWKLVLKATKNKVFGTEEFDGTTEDEIIEVDPKKNIKYLNLNITGTLDDYKIKMKKAKKDS